MWALGSVHQLSEHFALHSGLAKLHDLNLSGGSATDESIASLLPLTKLQSLTLDYCHGVTDAGVAALAALPGLESLGLVDCSLSDQGMAR
jgi:hypothetical protein